MNDSSRDNDAKRMTLIEHLFDLRRCLIVSLLAVGVGFIIAFYFSEEILKFLTRVTSPENKPTFIFLSPAEALWSNFKVAFFAGVILALPVVLYEVWRFVSPGLNEEERRYAAPFIILSLISFCTGLIFCYMVILRFAMSFLLTYKTSGLTPMISIGYYLDFVIKFMLAFGLIFELPFVIVFLARIGIITPEFLSKNRKYAILINFIVAAILTPTPDVFNQCLMAVPLMVLYELGIIGAKIFGSDKDK